MDRGYRVLRRLDAKLTEHGRGPWRMPLERSLLLQVRGVVFLLVWFLGSCYTTMKPNKYILFSRGYSRFKLCLVRGSLSTWGVAANMNCSEDSGY